ncbi:MAG: enoyl-CoA hydratase/isomerase family protein [Alphaproteobacteria bacterium]
MADDLVTYDSSGGVATITLNRPDKLNAIDSRVCEGLRAAFARLHDGADRAGVLIGAGPRAFTAGADVNDVPELARCIPGVGVVLDKPIVAAVHGHCIGGGVILAMMADLAVADVTARFSYPEARLGLSGGMIAALAGRIAHKHAMELMLLGATFDAERARAVGLVNQVVPAGEHLAAARAMATTLAGHAPLVVAMLKRFVAESILPKGPSEHAGMARREIGRVMASADAKEGVAAAIAARPPRFEGR